MTANALERLLADSAALARAHPAPADFGAAIAPLVRGLLAHVDSFHPRDLAPGTRRNVDPAHNES
jgi:hypothetical protein